MKNWWRIHIVINHYSKKEAIIELEKVLKEIKNSKYEEDGVDISEHDDDYLPYIWCTAGVKKCEVFGVL